ncbi:MAG: NADH-quinone oxidoreductase subunit J [Bryobacteraceae bacterium]
MDALLFGLFATIAVVCGFVMVTQKHPITSALSLVGVMGSLAILYLLLGAPFIAAAQLIVYAGAIMVLFLFVIMLLNAGAEPKPARSSLLAKVIGIPLIIALLGMLSFLIHLTVPPADTMVKFGGNTPGSPEAVGRALFTTYLLPFEVTSVLVLIAILGAVVLARKEMD